LSRFLDANLFPLRLKTLWLAISASGIIKNLSKSGKLHSKKENGPG
jgi:hypothetical protein